MWRSIVIVIWDKQAIFYLSGFYASMIAQFVETTTHARWLSNKVYISVTMNLLLFKFQTTKNYRRNDLIIILEIIHYLSMSFLNKAFYKICCRTNVILCYMCNFYGWWELFWFLYRLDSFGREYWVAKNFPCISLAIFYVFVK